MLPTCHSMQTSWQCLGQLFLIIPSLSSFCREEGKYMSTCTPTSYNRILIVRDQFILLSLLFLDPLGMGWKELGNLNNHYLQSYHTNSGSSRAHNSSPWVLRGKTWITIPIKGRILETSLQSFQSNDCRKRREKNQYPCYPAKWLVKDHKMQTNWLDTSIGCYLM